MTAILKSHAFKQLGLEVELPVQILGNLFGGSLGVILQKREKVPKTLQ